MERTERVAGLDDLGVCLLHKRSPRPPALCDLVQRVVYPVLLPRGRGHGTQDARHDNQEAAALLQMVGQRQRVVPLDGRLGEPPLNGGLEVGGRLVHGVVLQLEDDEHLRAPVLLLGDDVAEAEESELGEGHAEPHDAAALAPVVLLAGAQDDEEDHARNEQGDQGVDPVDEEHDGEVEAEPHEREGPVVDGEARTEVGRVQRHQDEGSQVHARVVEQEKHGQKRCDAFNAPHAKESDDNRDGKQEAATRLVRRGGIRLPRGVAPQPREAEPVQEGHELVLGDLGEQARGASQRLQRSTKSRQQDASNFDVFEPDPGGRGDVRCDGRHGAFVNERVSGGHGGKHDAADNIDDGGKNLGSQGALGDGIGRIGQVSTPVRASHDTSARWEHDTHQSGKMPLRGKRGVEIVLKVLRTEAGDEKARISDFDIRVA
mmetsp:Transcript_7629/g.17571  ORF Transcript_7629/g.17571 Transcript_7629/m.17571 type:complete len:431 (-) Transcript_7629:1158-2450(-)